MGCGHSMAGGELLLPALRIRTDSAHRALCQVVQEKDTQKKIRLSVQKAGGLFFCDVVQMRWSVLVQQYDLYFNLDIFLYLLHVSMQQNLINCL